ncbi:MAG: Xaa-Pro dipeptidase [Oscillospiraceae bacterium]|nr:Xaa-Pro dipeptidase [Oscillospiraceae bacterium]
MKYECHGHIAADGVSYARAMARHANGADEASLRASLAAVAARGVTYYRDGGDKLGVSEYAKKLAPEYGIEYRTPLFILHKKGFYGQLYGIAYGDMREYASIVRTLPARGADFVKITVSGMLDFAGDGGVLGDATERGELAELVNIAHGEGLRVMAHCNGAENIKNALRSGVDSLEHGFWADREAVDLLCETGAVWVPTCAAVSNLVGEGRYGDAALTAILNRHGDMLRYAAARGALIASGSDCGAYRVLQGVGTDDEYAALRRLDIDPQRGNEAVATRFVRG